MRDRVQGELVLYLLKEYMPKFPMNEGLLRALLRGVENLDRMSHFDTPYSRKAWMGCIREAL